MSIVRNVYIIMPVGSDPLFADRRAALALGAKRGGREAIFPAYLLERPTFSLRNLVENLLQAESVIADVSLERPSCYYEIGVVETLGKPIQLIAQGGTPIHQCLSRDKVRYYSDLSDLTCTVENALRELTLAL